MQWVKIKKISKDGIAETYDIWNKQDDCLDKQGNFITDGTVVHNSIPTAVKNREDSTGSWRRRLQEIHPLLYEILKDTYGVIVWQEQLAAIWQNLGGFTAPEAQDARKAVAKKWTHKLRSIREKWLAGASRHIGEKHAVEYWSLMETFGRYAFNRCLNKDTLLRDANTNEVKTIEEWYKSGTYPSMLSYDGSEFVVDKCVDIHYTGKQEVFEVEFDNGQKETVTMDHKFLCSDGEYHEVREIIERGLEITEAVFNKCVMSAENES